MKGRGKAKEGRSHAIISGFMWRVSDNASTSSGLHRRTDCVGGLVCVSRPVACE